MTKRRHPDISGCVVRLTDDALGDLKKLFKADPQIVRWALRTLIQIERDPRAGEPLLGGLGLIGYRKIAVAARDWRVIWRVQQDEWGNYVVEVAEVWAVGYRKDGEVYQEISERIARSEPSVSTSALSDVLMLFAKQSRGLVATAELSRAVSVPRWLSDALLYVVRLPRDEVARLSVTEAEQLWAAHISSSENG